MRSGYLTLHDKKFIDASRHQLNDSLPPSKQLPSRPSASDLGLFSGQHNICSRQKHAEAGFFEGFELSPAFSRTVTYPRPLNTF